MKEPGDSPARVTTARPHPPLRTGRRALLGGLVAACGALVATPEAAFARRRDEEGAEDGKGGAKGAGTGKLVSVERDGGGVTLTFALEHAPFPSQGAAYRDRSVVVFVPHHYRLPGSGRIEALVHFHGHNNTALAALREHALREQFAESKQNAILVAPQGPLRAADSSGGKLESPGGLKRMLDELVRELVRGPVKKALGPASLGGAKRFGTLCLSAHSGGYRVTAACLQRGGIDVSEVYLFDSLYGAMGLYYEWLVEGHKRGFDRKLISFYATPPVKANNLALMKDLETAGLEVLHEEKPGELSRKQLTKGSAIFIGSPLDHNGVTFRHNGLRDCLYASRLHRRQKSDWFANKNGARKIDAR